MKSFQRITTAAVLVLLTTSIGPCLQALNFSKLGVSKVSVKNRTQQPQRIEITFWEKCAGCPRLHGTSRQDFRIDAQSKLKIDGRPHVIKQVRAYNRSKQVNVEVNKNNRVSLSIETQKKYTPPIEIDFATLVQKSGEYKALRTGHKDHTPSLPKGVGHKAFFDKLAKLHKKNALHKVVNKTARLQPKISRVIHQIWFGRHPMPKQFRKWQEEWKELHPTWIFIEWNEDRIQKKFPHGLRNQTIYDEARMMYDYATMSKVARYEILDKFGGLYVDPDVKCYENMQPLHHAYDFYAGLGSSYKTFGLVNNGVIGSRARHPILRAAIEYIKSCETKPGGLYDWTAKNLSMQPLTHAVWQQAGRASGYNDIIFPRSVFDCNDVKKEFNHTQEIYEAGYVNVKHQPETLCSRGVYSYQK